jgi:adhesin transport system outer membrane protein
VASRLEGMQADVSEVRANVRVAMSNFSRLTGQVPAALSFLNRMPPTPQDLSDAQMAELIADNPDLMGARKQVDAYRLAVRSAAAGFMPRVDFLASTQRNDNVGSTLGPVTENKSMLVLTYALYNGGSDIAAVAEALAKVDEQLARCEVLERQLRSDAETTLAGLRSLDGRFKATRRQIRLDTEVVESFGAQLSNGNRPLLDVLDAHQRLYQSRLQLLSIGVTQAQAYLRLSYQTGRLGAGTLEVR